VDGALVGAGSLWPPFFFFFFFGGGTPGGVSLTWVGW
jgi:hypothetical protein